MKSRTLIISIALAAAVLRAQAPATLSIELSRPKGTVSPTLYGLMTEEINYSYDGGLYAELIRNRTFRSDWTGILNWFVVEKGGASARISVDNRIGPSEGLSIGYDALNTYGSPSYYAQVMFASCLGDHTLNSSASGTGDKFFYSITGSPGKLCVKLVNASSVEQPIAISLNGLGAGAHTAHIDTLKGDTMWATNTIAHPERIVPVKSMAGIKGDRWQHVMPGYSIQVLQIDLK